MEECATQPPEWGAPLPLTWLEQERSLLNTGEWESEDCSSSKSGREESARADEEPLCKI